MNRRPSSVLVPYGHPATWPGDQIGAPLVLPYGAAFLRLTVGLGPGYVLGVDQATSSGWSCWSVSEQRPMLSGVVKHENELKVVFDRLVGLPGFSFARLLVVFEDHRHRPGHANVLLSLGDARGMWRALCMLSGQPPSRRLLVDPFEWRRVMGTRVNLQRDAWKAQAKLWATAVTGRRIDDDDEAEGLGVGRWAAWDGLYQWCVRDARTGRTQARAMVRKGKKTANDR